MDAALELRLNILTCRVTHQIADELRHIRIHRLGSDTHDATDATIAKDNLLADLRHTVERPGQGIGACEPKLRTGHPEEDIRQAFETPAAD
jgi:hypothetical protein